MAQDEHVGGTIRMLRKAAGLTQTQLARRASVSLSLLSKVECGDRAATHALLAAVARALRVPVERLTGQPYSDNHHDAAAHTAVDAIRSVLRRADLCDDSRHPRPLDQLTAEVAAVSKLRRDANYRRLATVLPGVLEDLTAVAREANSSAAATIHSLLATTYHAAHTVLYRLGYADLAEVVEHKLTDTAVRSGDPLAEGLALWARAQSFQAAGDYVHGLHVMDGARARLEDQLRHHPSPAAITVYGSLHLRSVTLASRAGKADLARDHVAEARALAARLGGSDQVHYGLTFGPANVTTHETAAHVELGDAAAALAAAEHWQPPRTMPRTRRGHHYIDLARAHLMHGNRHACLAALQQARRIAPQQTRLHPMVRDTTAVLVSLHRRSNPELASYAGWLGLNH